MTKGPFKLYLPMSMAMGGVGHDSNFLAQTYKHNCHILMRTDNHGCIAEDRLTLFGFWWDTLKPMSRMKTKVCMICRNKDLHYVPFPIY